MGFRVFCDINHLDEKGKEVKCRREMEPCIDKKTGELFCECGRLLNDQKKITEFAKRQMVSLGQVRKDEKPSRAFSVKCGSCKKENPPKLKNNVLTCPFCGTAHTGLAKPFEQMLRANIGRL